MGSLPNMYRYWTFNLFAPALTASLLLFAYFALYELWRKKEGKQANWARAVMVSIFFGYLAGLFGITLDLGNILRDGLVFDGGYNLVPFKQIWGFLNFLQSDHTGVNLFGNILVFIPIGLFVPLLWEKRRPVLAGTLWAAGISLFIELFQLMTPRVTDIDDLILNTLGGLCGALLYKLLCRLFPVFGRVFKRA